MSHDELVRIREELAALREEFRLATVEGHDALVSENWDRLRAIAKEEHALIERFKALIDSAISGKPIT